MALRARTGTAIRWRPPALDGEASDVLRVVERDGVLLALLANGYESGFSTCWPVGSRRILDLFVEAWSSSSGTAQARLEMAFSVARRRFVEEHASIEARELDTFDDEPAAVLLAVAIEQSSVHMGWIGGDVAVVSREARVIASTTPHTLHEKAKREHAESTHHSALPNVVVRTIASHGADVPPEFVEARVEDGDSVLLLSHVAFRGPCVSIAEAVSVADAEPAIVAEKLASIGFDQRDAAYTAVVAIRIESREAADRVAPR